MKWAGSKRQLLPQLLEKALAHSDVGTYYEPMVGGGALFWELRARDFARRYVLGDSCERLIRTYRAIRDGVEDLIEKLSYLKYNRETFDRLRAMEIDARDDVEVAAWFIALNRTCFNGLYRVNKKGQFNVPFGCYSNPTICDAENLRACSRALRGVDLRTGDFGGTVQAAGRHPFEHKQGVDFVYFDPPYAPTTKTAHFTAYGKDGFGPDEQLRLRDVALSLRERGGARVLVSNSEAARPLYAPRFRVTSISEVRAINSRGSKRGAVPAILAE